MWHRRNIWLCALAATFFAQAPLAALSASATAQSAPIAMERLAGRLDAARPDDAAILAFYAARNGGPLWHDAARADALREAIARAPEHGLPVLADAASLPLSTDASEGAEAARELAFTRAFITLARALGSGVVEPRSVSRDILRVPVRTSVPELLAAAAAAPDMVAHLAGLAPADPAYGALRQRFAALSAMPAEVWGAPVPAGPTLRPGERSERIPALRARLAAKGDLVARDRPADRLLFDPSLVHAVRSFQQRHGLNDDGVVGPMTLAAINATPAERAAQIAANLERLRWMNHPLGIRRIVVNQPDFTVTFFDGDTVLFHERVIIGMRDRQTPEFSDQMTHLVFNPTWFVPRSIATKDILPRLQADPTYLARSNMVLSRGDGGPVPADPSAHDFSGYSASDFPYRIRQRPDSDNALGQVKFMFPNNHAIYLHDTPKRSLFARDSRAFSSGCVRVRDPLRLAELLLAPQRPDARQSIDTIVAGGRERYITLEEPVPVHLIYRTAWVDAQGRDHFRDDIYGRDAALADRLRRLGAVLPGA